MLKKIVFSTFGVIYFQAVVFMIGGGNYIEYQNLQDYVEVNYIIVLFVKFTRTKNRVAFSSLIKIMH